MEIAGNLRSCFSKSFFRVNITLGFIAQDKASPSQVQRFCLDFFCFCPLPYFPCALKNKLWKAYWLISQLLPTSLYFQIIQIYNKKPTTPCHFLSFFFFFSMNFAVGSLAQKSWKISSSTSQLKGLKSISTTLLEVPRLLNFLSSMILNSFFTSSWPGAYMIFKHSILFDSQPMPKGNQ